jgi:hypothetical protein
MEASPEGRDQTMLMLGVIRTFLGRLLLASFALGAVSVHAQDQADLQLNYNACIAGYVCNQALLTPEQTQLVRQSDLQRNYNGCIAGYVCNQALLNFYAALG